MLILNTSHPLNRGRRLWLRADPGDGGLTMFDLVRGQQATLTGFASGQGIVAGHRNGRPRSFLANNNTTGAYADLFAINPIPYTQETFSVAIWVYFRTIANSRQSVMIRGQSTGGQMGFLINGPAPGSSIWRFQSGTASVNASLLAVTTWYRLLVTVNGTAIRMFKNGVLDTIGTGQLSGSYPTNTIWQIASDTNNNRPIDGFVDSFSVWDYALPDSLAWADYTEELTGCQDTLSQPRIPLYADVGTPPPATLPWMIGGDFPSYGYVEA